MPIIETVATPFMTGWAIEKQQYDVVWERIYWLHRMGDESKRYPGWYKFRAANYAFGVWTLMIVKTDDGEPPTAAECRAIWDLLSIKYKFKGRGNGG
jgi:hypothetical protein